MGIKIFGREIGKVGIIGAGQIGPDIALHFSKSLVKSDVKVVVNDIVESAIENAKEKVSKKISKGVETGAFKQDEARKIFENINFTLDKNELTNSDIIIEAATEDIAIKKKIFAEVETLVDDNAIITSNSSHLEPEVIFAEMKKPDRCLVIHYFFPAERNQLVEIIPSEKTKKEVVEFCMQFYEWIGKVPVEVKSRYGYAVDPIFEGLFEASCLCVEEGIATPKEVDAIACKSLGLGVGPFTAMNLTGGNKITQHGLNEMNKKIMPWFKSPRMLDEKIKLQTLWETAQRSETIEYSEDKYNKVSKRLMGAFFGLACEIIDSGIIDLSDLEMAVEIGLVMNPPFSMMNKIGITEALNLVKEYARLYEGFKIPESLTKQAEMKQPWKTYYLRKKIIDDVALVTIKRPRYLNALNNEVLAQLREVFEEIKNDKKVKSVVLSAFGTRAFVSGADIIMLSKIQTKAEGENSSRYFNDTLSFIENIGKPVVCAMNGLAFGGGNELAMACTLRVARKGIKTLAGQPEVKLGLIPGAGGTQRLPRLIPFNDAFRLLRTGESISSETAKELGLVFELYNDDELINKAVELTRKISSGELKVKPINKNPIEIPAQPPTVDIGTLSKKVDSILQKAILEGCKMPLADGLNFESKCFGEITQTKDFKIGIENFLKTNLKEPAKFVHE